MKRYLVELGMGADLHGGDVTKAVKRAMKDAVSHCCMCGLTEILNLDVSKKLSVYVKIACPHPEKVRLEELQDLVPVGKMVIDELCNGGMTTRGLHVDSLGEGDQIVVALVSLTVVVEE